MPLPYHIRSAPEKRGKDIVPLMLYFGNLERLIGHIVRRPLRQMPDRILAPLLSVYARLANRHMFDFEPLKFFAEASESYYKLIDQMGPYQKMDSLCAMYIEIFSKLEMGQQALFHHDQNLAANNKYDEAQYQIQMAKYLTLHDFTVKATFSMVTYCLDVMGQHKDLRKTIPEYVSDDLSYKVGKLRKAGYSQLEHLTTGIESHLRNAIAHQSYQFINHYTVRFEDRDWNLELKLGFFTPYVEKLETNFEAQAAALNLFAWDNQSSVSDYMRNNPIPLTERRLQELITESMIKSFFVPHDISVGEEKIRCAVKKKPGFDGPEEVIGQIGNGNMYRKTRPALDLDRQVLNLAADIADCAPKQAQLEVVVLNLDGAECRRYEMDLQGIIRVFGGKEPQEKGSEYLKMTKILPDCS